MSQSTTNALTAKRLVLFSDQSAQIVWLAHWLESEGFTVIQVATLAECAALDFDKLSLVLLDLSPNQLRAALAALRANSLFSQAVIFIRAERIPDAAALAGVGPSHRALICYHTDLVALIKHETHKPLFHHLL